MLERVNVQAGPLAVGTADIPKVLGENIANRSESAPEAGAPEKNEAIDILAKALRDTMDHLDPSDEPIWENLDEDTRWFYRKCIKDLCLHRDPLRALLN
jgi:hypothetical protein